MIRIKHDPEQLRVDTQIKIIEKDGTKISVPVVVLVGLNKVNETKQWDIYKMVNSLFNYEMVMDKRNTPPKKKWWKIW